MGGSIRKEPVRGIEGKIKRYSLAYPDGHDVCEAEPREPVSQKGSAHGNGGSEEG